jgi:hypothetical protein
MGGGGGGAAGWLGVGFAAGAPAPVELPADELFAGAFAVGAPPVFPEAKCQSRAIGQLCQFSFCTSVCRAK